MLKKWFLSHTAPIPPAPQGAIKVACIGDSITYGTGVRQRARNCYPAQLEALLGLGYAVRNFGVNGHTLLNSADLPYRGHPHFARSATFQPDIVIIMLGTNDSKRENWSSIAEYSADYRSLLSHYRSLASQPEIYLMTPPTAHMKRSDGKLWYGMSNAIMDQISAALQELARQENVRLIDLRAATADQPECFTFDGVHTNAEGAALIARTVFEALGR